MDRELHAQIIRMAKEAGMGNNKFGFVTQLLEKVVKRRQRWPKTHPSRLQKSTRSRTRSARTARVGRA